jgi:hypothetical protein
MQGKKFVAYIIRINSHTSGDILKLFMEIEHRLLVKLKIK